MKKLMNWMTEVLAPKLNRAANNVYIASLQESIMSIMPFIFIGTLCTIWGIIRGYFPTLPDITVINNLTFGCLSIYLSYLIPSTIMMKKKLRKLNRQAGITGIALFFIITNTQIIDGNFTIILQALGAGGMIACILSGIFVGFVMSKCAKFSFFKEDSAMPDFIITWFDTLIPIFLILLLGWIIVYQCQINLYNLITDLFSPVIGAVENPFVYVLFNFFIYFCYTFGISVWVVYPITSVIYLNSITANAAAVAAGGHPTNIFVQETFSMMNIGGSGATLALAFMFAFMARSKHLKTIGRTVIVPSIFNINEPLIYGGPVAFNPILMIPMWIIGIIFPTINYIVFHFGIVPIPYNVNQIWYLPRPIYALLVTNSWIGFIYICVLFVISFLIYYPFFKIYDKQECDKELTQNN